MVLGMPHRGRLNVLANILNKPFEQIFREFKEMGNPEDFDGTGDVKYHLGWSIDRPAGPNNTNMHLTLLANPSHLEAVNPVVAGKVRAKQFFANDTSRTKSLGY
jgi:2-oxoglutarate dehydrogenase E1 component